MRKINYSSVTEMPHERVPVEQLERISERYHWAAAYAKDKEVIECACGAGQGANILNHISSSYIAGDLDGDLVSLSQKNNPNISFKIFDASILPFSDESFDVVLVCEAIYYFPNVSEFLQEAKRVLKKNGKVLIVTANPNLFDFNPSPHTHIYPSVINMGSYFSENGFKYISAEGGTDTSKAGLRQQLLRPVKFIASRLNLIPGTMKGKSWLKKLFFGGNFISMPLSVDYEENKSILVKSIDMSKNDKKHKVLYFVGEKI
jgi:ubiquinone/menaquinone biosynthesis C-methylase UbiE